MQFVDGEKQLHTLGLNTKLNSAKLYSLKYDH